MNSSAATTDSTIAQNEETYFVSMPARWLDRVILAMLFLFAAAAPHSIAGAQAAWGVGLLAWAARCFVRPRPQTFRTPLDYLLLGFFVLTGIAAFASYAPDISVGKLRAASLFTIVYLVAQNVRSRPVLRALVFTLLASCMVAALFTFGERVVGRGVSVRELAPTSPLIAAGVQNGDTLLTVDGESLRDLTQLESAMQHARAEGRRVLLRFYHVENYIFANIPDATLPAGASAAERLGVGSFARGRDWRAEGFYGHYTTFAEVLQLITTLAFGLLVAFVFRGGEHPGRINLTRGAGLFSLIVLASGGALLLTVTRASWLACAVGISVIVLVGVRNRVALAVCVLLALLIVPAALYVLQQKRSVKFLDSRDNSTTWRMTVYREGAELLASRPRHLLVGVGMDSIKRFRNKWGLFDNGRLPPGHFHSTPLQLAVERGLPTLAVWLALLFVYARMLWRLWRNEVLREQGLWLERGFALGALGGVAGFFTSGLVHYNLGDSEVAMIFYFIMGCALVVERFTRQMPMLDVYE
jgi:O-antigen ligase